MPTKSRPGPARTLCYVISDPARDIVSRTRDQLSLLARLTAARVRHDDAELEMPQPTLFHVLQTLCNDLDHALRDMKLRWPTGESPPERT